MNFQNTIKSVALTTLMVASVAVQAQAGKSPFSYDFIEVGAARQSVETAAATVDATSYGLAGSKMISNDIFVLGSFASVKVDGTLGGVVDPTSTDFSIGFGTRFSIAPNADLVASVSYDASNADNGDSKGYTLPIGIRFQALNNVEIYGSYYAKKVGDSRLRGPLLGASYSLSKEMEIGLDTTRYSGDIEGARTAVSLRYNF